MTENNHIKRKHSNLAPSSAERWIACPGSVLLSSKVPEPETTTYAAEGTEAHEWAEKALLSELPNAVIRQIPDKEMAHHVLGYALYIAKLKKSLKPFLFHVEAPTKLSTAIYGIADAGMMYHIGGGEVGGVIVDFKYGKGHSVSVENNMQMLCYALGYQKKASKGIKLKHCTVVIYQPRIDDEEIVRRHRYTKVELKTWQRKIVAAGNVALKMLRGERKPKFVAGAHCVYCPARGVCRELMDHTKAQTLVEIDKGAKLPDPTMLTDEQLLAIIKYRKIIETFMAGAVEYACTRSQRGASIPGTKLVEGRSQRVWIDDTDHVAKELHELGMTDPYNRKLKGIGEVEKAVGKGKIGHVTVKTTPKVTIALASDARPEVEVGKKGLSMLDELPDSSNTGPNNGKAKEINNKEQQSTRDDSHSSGKDRLSLLD